VGAQAAVWILVFYCGSFMSNVFTKEIVGGKVISSTSLAVLQLGFSVVVDGESQLATLLNGTDWLSQRLY
jgi:hypothetical protein